MEKDSEHQLRLQAKESVPTDSFSPTLKWIWTGSPTGLWNGGCKDMVIKKLKADWWKSHWLWWCQLWKNINLSGFWAESDHQDHATRDFGCCCWGVGVVICFLFGFLVSSIWNAKLTYCYSKNNSKIKHVLNEFILLMNTGRWKNPQISAFFFLNFYTILSAAIYVGFLQKFLSPCFIFLLVSSLRLRFVSSLASNKCFTK